MGEATGLATVSSPAAWAFAVRIWTAMTTALGVAFWLQLDGASSAAVTVGILALPTRGQALQKAAYRFVGNAVGVAASILIVALFPQARDLYILAFALWIGLCVFFSGLLDGNRAYGAVLCGYTVAVVAVQQIDDPASVFLNGVNRGAAIAVGIATLAVVNLVFEAPTAQAKLMQAFEGARRDVRALASDAFEHGFADPLKSVAAMHAVAALHADASALSSEWPGGPARASAARNLMTALAAEISEVRAFAAKPDERLSSEAWADFEAARPPAAVRHSPIYRSFEAARRNGLRAVLATMLAAIPFVLGGWPSSAVGYSLVGLTMALSSIAPHPAAFARGALIALPLAAVCAGITEFFVLDGVDQFPLLGIALAPPVFLGTHLVTSRKPKLVGVGSLLLVFFPVLLAPSNPESYNPEAYVDGSVLAVIAVVMLSILLATLLPTSDERRLEWISRSIRRDVRGLAIGRATRLSPEEAAFRDADRVAQIAALDARIGERDIALREALGLFDLAGAIRRARAVLTGRAVGGAEAARRAEALAALRSGDARRLRAASATWTSVPRLAADLALAARIVAASRGGTPSAGGP